MIYLTKNRHLRFTIFIGLIFTAALFVNSILFAENQIGVQFRDSCENILKATNGPVDIRLQMYWEHLGFHFPIQGAKTLRGAPAFGFIELSADQIKHINEAIKNNSGKDETPGYLLGFTSDRGLIPVSIIQHRTPSSPIPEHSIPSFNADLITIEHHLGKLTFEDGRSTSFHAYRPYDDWLNRFAKSRKLSLRPKDQTIISNAATIPFDKNRNPKTLSFVQYLDVFHANNPYAKEFLKVALPSIEWKKVNRVLVLGTGSGIDVVMIRKYLKRMRITRKIEIDAVDIKPWAVSNTLANAAFHDAHQNLNAFVSDGFYETKGSYDIIIFDSPVPASFDSKNVNAHDPFGNLLSRLLSQTPKYLTQDGAFYMMNVPDLRPYVNAHLKWEVLKKFSEGDIFGVHRFTRKK
jgi:hypothetical protein